MTHLGYTLIDDQALQTIINESIEEQQRRRAAASLPGEIERLIEDFQAATGLGTGEDWKQPAGAHATHGAGNVWEPGRYGWEEVA